MKTILRLLILLSISQCVEAQITTPVIKANFGVDGELRANYFNGFIQSGNDDWFNNGTFGFGQFVIDTTGAAATVARYAIDPNYRKLPFFRTMRVAPYSLMNNRLVIDAVFIRDYHGDDSTIFASGSNKNGMSPADWSCPVSQSIPDKNDILDMFVHVRRAGPNATDSLWMFGGVSIENTTGNRYFDFEMYQTDIYYDRVSRKFYGYGPDAGHTSWQFDAAGNITRPGDIIFTAQYSSSSLTLLEARIWVDSASLSISPATFDWNGSFDGANSSSQFGYAGIIPKTAGAFYTGLTCPNNTWAGPFALIREDNSLVPNYIAGQFMEFSVNLTKLGLDPVTLLGGDACGMPFRRILVKTRSSTSFTAELKDFVGPFDFFLAPRAQAAADVPLFCGSVGVSDISVTNPVSTSTYSWSTTDGHIVGSTTGATITVDSPGTYVVSQTLQSGCSIYATDTVSIAYDPNCLILESKLVDFRGTANDHTVQLNWTVTENEASEYFDVEMSTDGINFKPVGRVNAKADDGTVSYSYTDNASETTAPFVYYRIKIKSKQGYAKYSNVVRIMLGDIEKTGITITPNPVKDMMQVNISSATNEKLQIYIYDITGRLMRSLHTQVQQGFSAINLTGFKDWQKGVYAVKVVLGSKVYVEKTVFTK